MARERRQGPHGLLRRSRQRRRDDRVPRPGHPALAQVAQEAQPAPQPALDADASHRRALAAPGPTHAPLPQRPLLRQHPRQEPGALTRTPGSARGAAGNGGPYRHHATTTHDAAMALIAAGVNDCEIARRLSLPRTTVRDWRAPRYERKP